MARVSCRKRGRAAAQLRPVNDVRLRQGACTRLRSVRNSRVPVLHCTFCWLLSFAYVSERLCLLRMWLVSWPIVFASLGLALASALPLPRLAIGRCVCSGQQLVSCFGDWWMSGESSEESNGPSA